MGRNQGGLGAGSIRRQLFGTNQIPRGLRGPGNRGGQGLAGAGDGGRLSPLRQLGTVRGRARIRLAQQWKRRCCGHRVLRGDTGLRRGERCRRSVPGSGGLGADDGEQPGLRRGDAPGQLAAPFRVSGLLAQGSELRVPLVPAVAGVQQVGLGGAQLAVRLRPAGVQAGDARGLVEQPAPFLRASLDDGAHLALAHHRKRARTASEVGE